MSSRRPTSAAFLRSRRGSVLIIVMWTCFGLVALTLYFAQSMSSELRAADNRVVGVGARQALLGGVRYVNYVLTHYALSGTVPLSADYKAESLLVGDSYFWIIGRDPNQVTTTNSLNVPFYGIVDESSKLNINYATSAMLQNLPGMTPDLATAIVAWRSASQTSASSNNTYAQLDPPRLPKHGLFETTDELRLVYGATLDRLLGEDTNRNGVIDPNENDGDKTAPHDNQNGLLDAGILEYVTAFGQRSTTRSDGSSRYDVATPANYTRAFRSYLANTISQQRANQILDNLRRGPAQIGSVAEFYVIGQIRADEFAKIHGDITDSAAPGSVVNVNTASQTVLSCIPGITADKASAMVAYRTAHPDSLSSLAWIVPILGVANVRLAGPHITDQSYWFSADIAAVGRKGRGYCREKIVFDTSKGGPRIVFRQDLTSYGWALGSDVRETLKSAKQLWQ